MLYLGTSPHDPGVRFALDTHRIGLMCQPRSNKPRAGWLWAADNGCFSERWQEDRWRRWLERYQAPLAGCLFAVVPDVVGDPLATLQRFERYEDLVRDAGYPVAFAMQDGAEADNDWIPPYSHFDCLFIGGSDAMKMSEDTIDVAVDARAHGKWVHVGRVNSWSRFQAWAPFADSCDGTLLTYGPSVNLARLRSWLDRNDHAPQLAVHHVG